MSLTILDTLARHAASKPDQTAFIHLGDAWPDDRADIQRITFAGLAVRVDFLADRLRTLAQPGERALLLYPNGIEFIVAFLACLRAEIIAVPASLPRKPSQFERLQSIFDDCRPVIVATTSMIAPHAEAGFLNSSNATTVVATDSPSNAHVSMPLAQPDVPSNRTAFLQYTSGSTRVPRGVVVTHANLISNQIAIHEAFRRTEKDVVVSWLPMFHDMGLIGTVLHPLYLGSLAVTLSPLAFLRAPILWLRAIAEFGGTTSGAPNFAYDYCVERIAEQEKKSLDLRSWTAALNGSEPVRAETIDRFLGAFSSCGVRRDVFFPCYGLAEATLFVSGGKSTPEPQRLHVDPTALEKGNITLLSSDEGRCLVSSGCPASGTHVIAVDPATRTVQPAGTIGELWVSSPSVASGYWGTPQISDSAFRNYLSDGEGPYLATGDLGFLNGRDVYVTGRTKDLVIIAGRNIYPTDIECLVRARLPFVQHNACAVFGVPVGCYEQLAVAIEVPSSTHNEDVPTMSLANHAENIRAAISSRYEVPVATIAFIERGAFLRTSSGKVQRQACCAALLRGALPIAYQWRSPLFAAQPVEPDVLEQSHSRVS